FLLESSSFQTNGSVSLGQAYDTSIDAQDLVFKFSLAGQDFLLDGHVEYVTGVGLAGDFNGDGTVDAADDTVWRNNLGGDDSVLGGNGNNDGVVDQDDYTMWKSNFGQPAPAALGLTSSQVPEPSSLVLVGLAASGLLYFARRRS